LLTEAELNEIVEVCR